VNVLQQVRVERNPAAQHGAYPTELEPILSSARHAQAFANISTWPGYEPTPLHTLTAQRDQLGIGQLWLKDESARFGLGAFKSIGGAYAVYRYLESRIRAQHSDARVTPETLIRGDYKHLTEKLTVACASAGNHGRAVAWGARLFGAHCVVYLYQGVSAGRKAAIEQLGASIDTSSPNYDDAVRRVARVAEENNWQIISDTAYPGYMDIPRDVMQGYTVIAREVIEQLGRERPTHVFLQAGVGGFAAAMCAHFWQEWREHRPLLITVEPTGAACVLESVAAGALRTLPNVHSMMGGLCCGEVSLLAWDILQRAVDWCVAIPDDVIPATMFSLTLRPPKVIAGESGAAGLAALALVCADETRRRTLGLDRGARVLLFSTEGATDPARYEELTGLKPEATA
jgi:diaminopropionate ammonia-lyase